MALALLSRLRTAPLVVGLTVAALLLGSPQGAAAAPPPGSVIYEIFVRSFQDSDGDGIGDLPGVISRLDYLEWLGVTDLWLMPINPSPSEHGYDPTDYLGVESDYGNLEDLRVLIEQARGRGIRLILDLVVNHTSDQHPWFIASAAGDPRYRDYYLWRETRPGWRGLGAGSPWHERAGAYYLGLFTHSQPDLDHRNPAVRREIEEAATFFLNLGVAGFRVDAVQHVVEGEEGEIRNTPETFAWLARFEEFVKGVDPNAYLLGETWISSPLIARYHRDSGLDMSTNYPLWEAILSGVQGRNPAGLRVVLEQDERLYPAGAVRGPFISNHDQMRPATRLAFLRSDPARLRLAAAMLLTVPGVPILYYGEELGMPNGPGDDDREKRTPMRWEPGLGGGFTTGSPWHAFSSEDPSLAVSTQRSEEGSLLNWYRGLIAARRASPALSAGDLEVIDAGNGAVLAFEREHSEERVLVLANFASRPAEVDLTAMGAAGARDLLTGAITETAISLPATTAVVLRLP
jgi:alpha-amylase